MGFQRQLNGQTIENELEIALIKSDYITSFQANNYRGSSRTDVNVNAIGNVIVVEMRRRPNLMEINSFLPDDILLWAWSEVPIDFNPREKVIKTYRYYLPISLASDSFLSDIQEYKGYFDYSPFIKKDGAGTYNPFCSILSITINTVDNYYSIDIKGDHFGREQIRRMIGFLLDKKLDTSPLDILENQMNIEIHAAPGENLFLLEVQYKLQMEWNIEKNLVYRLNWISERNQDISRRIKLVELGLEELTSMITQGSQ